VDIDILRALFGYLLFGIPLFRLLHVPRAVLFAHFQHPLEMLLGAGDELVLECIPGYLNFCWQFIMLSLYTLVALYVTSALATLLSPKYRFARKVGRRIQLILKNKDAPKRSEVSLSSPVPLASQEREKMLGMVFLILTVVSTLLWYCRKYDPSGTIKPRWTENLGRDVYL
jgi:hypothetical protein